MRKVFLCLFLVLMTACSTNNRDVKGWMNDYLSHLGKENFKIVSNHNKEYYNYYVPSNISNIESTDTHNIFKLNNVDIIMNLDIASIINKNLYNNKSTRNDKIYDDEYLIYSSNKYIFLENPYAIDIYEINGKYLINVVLNNVSLVSFTNINTIKDIIREMLIIGSSVEIYEDEIVNNFSSKDIIDFKKEQVDLFEMVIPKDGLLEELLDPNLNIETNSPEPTETSETENVGEEDTDK